MHRTIRLLRPAGLRGATLSPALQTRSALARPTLLPVTSALASPRSTTQLLGSVRLYADSKKPDTPAKPSTHQENPHGTQQGAVGAAVEEIRNVARDVADMISAKSGYHATEKASSEAAASTTATSGSGQTGGSVPKTMPAAMAAMETSSHSHGGSARDDFVSLTKSIVTAVPQPVLYTGLAGTIPYLGTAASIVFMSREASRASQGLNTLTGLDLHSALNSLHTLEHIQITYGAIILSFLGAIHWGMEFSKLGGTHGYNRLMLGVVPVLFAWPTTFLSHGVALAVQWLGFTGMWFVDQRASSNGWTTHWYSTYRFYLSIIVGFSIIGTLVGTGYYGAGAGATSAPYTSAITGTGARLNTVQNLQNLKKSQKGPGKMSGTVAGDVQIDDSGDGESYNKLRNIKKEEEQEEHEKEVEKKEKADKKQKNEEFQDKRDEHQQDKAPGTMKSDAKDRTGINANQPGGSQEKAQGGSEGVGGKGRMGKVESESSGSEKAKGSVDETSGGKDGKQGGDTDKKSGGEKAKDSAGEGQKGGSDASEEKGKSQQKKDNPDEKGKAGEKLTSLK